MGTEPWSMSVTIQVQCTLWAPAFYNYATRKAGIFII